MLQELQEYVRAFAERGTCRCGRCVDHPGEDRHPEGHTVDMVFFEVAAKGTPDSGRLRELISGCHRGEFCELDLLDGKEHSYIEIGGWIGDQGLALMLMGLGTLLGLWDLITPKMLPGMTSELVSMLAGQGMVAIVRR